MLFLARWITSSSPAECCFIRRRLRDTTHHHHYDGQCNRRHDHHHQHHHHHCKFTIIVNSSSGIKVTICHVQYDNLVLLLLTAHVSNAHDYEIVFPLWGGEPYHHLLPTNLPWTDSERQSIPKPLCIYQIYHVSLFRLNINKTHHWNPFSLQSRKHSTPLKTNMSM